MRAILLLVVRQTWVVPFIYLCLVLWMAMLTQESTRTSAKQKLLGTPNYYLTTGLILIVLSILATAVSGLWIDVIAWLGLVIAGYLTYHKLLPLPTEKAKDTEAF